LRLRGGCWAALIPIFWFHCICFDFSPFYK
jgi:hypothetical protein